MIGNCLLNTVHHHDLHGKPCNHDGLLRHAQDPVDAKRMTRIEKQFALMELQYLLGDHRASDRRQADALVRVTRSVVQRPGSQQTHALCLQSGPVRQQLLWFRTCLLQSFCLSKPNNCRTSGRVGSSEQVRWRTWHGYQRQSVPEYESSAGVSVTGNGRVLAAVAAEACHLAAARHPMH